MTVRLLKNEDLEGLLTAPELLDPMERAFRDLGDRQLEIAEVNPQRQRIHYEFDPDAPGLNYWLNNISGVATDRRVTAVRLDSSHRVEEDTPKHPNERYTGLVLLFDMDTTDLVGVTDDHFISTLRVAATSGIAARHLLPSDTERLGLFGSGEQAGPHLEVFAHLGDFDEIAVYSRTRENRETFAERYDGQVDASVVAVESPREAVVGSDAVVTATSAMDPVFDGEWLEPGSHVNKIVGSDRYTDREEVDLTTVRRADRIYCNRFDQVVDDRQGSLFELLEAGELDPEDVTELPDLIAGHAAGRQSDDEITLMANNTGMGIQFAVTGDVLLERAAERDVGRELPREWFTTEMGEESWSP